MATAFAANAWAGPAGSPPEPRVDLPTRVAALDCRAVSGADVAEVLARSPAPRVIALHGSVPIVTMEPFAQFLQAMGYPADRLVNPVDGTRTYSSYVDTRRLAGQLAWHYEQEGLMPMLIGHSQGGMVVIKLLHDLAGTRSSEPIPVWSPTREAPERRTSIIDPLTRQTRPVTDLKVAYAAVLATGSLPRLLLGQWGILPLLREVPDAVVEFTGFSIPWDPIAGTGPHPEPFRAIRHAQVRNVVLPSSYSHVRLPDAAHLAEQPMVRAWIEDYRPGPAASAGAAGAEGLPQMEGSDLHNLLHAADIWHSVKRHWCEAAKRLTVPPGAAPR